MRRYLSSFAMLLAELVVVGLYDARAQDAAPAGEVFATISKMWTYSRGANFDTSGGGGSIAGSVNRYLGAEMEIFKYSDYAQYPPAYANCYTLLFGPRFAYRGAPGIAPFAHVLVGLTRGRQLIPPPYPPGVIPNTGSALKGGNGFTVGFGGGLDVRAWRFVWIRAFQADYLRASFSNHPQNTLRLSFGAVVRWGRVP